ncbi:MAG: hypothetical protein ACREUG_01200 [Steroidobacteraceae bacterium]
MTVPHEFVHFLLLDREEQAAAIRRMASTGWSEGSIASATRLSIEQVRRILAERPAPERTS